MLYAIFAVVALIGVLWILLDWYPRRLRHQRFSGRAPMTNEQIASLFASAATDSEMILELWDEIAAFADVPRPLLLPDDRFDVELAPARGWEFGSELVSLEYAAQKRMKRLGRQIDLSKLRTVRDYIEVFAHGERGRS